VAEKIVFYSWQSDRPNPTNRNFIRQCLQKAVAVTPEDERIEEPVRIDSDTAGVPGSPDIVAEIFRKISKADAFVADVTFVSGKPGRRSPNPNVLVELGFAAALLGWERILLVVNEAFGKRKDLPFDLRQRRVAAYSLKEGQEKTETRKALVRLFTSALGEMLSSVNPAMLPKGLSQSLSQLAKHLVVQFVDSGGQEVRTWEDVNGFSMASGGSLIARTKLEKEIDEWKSAVAELIRHGVLVRDQHRQDVFELGEVTARVRPYLNPPPNNPEKDGELSGDDRRQFLALVDRLDAALAGDGILRSPWLTAEIEMLCNQFRRAKPLQREVLEMDFALKVLERSDRESKRQALEYLRESSQKLRKLIRYQPQD